LKPELQAMQTLRETFIKAYEAGPFMLPPEQLIGQLKEQLSYGYGGSRVVTDLVDQLQWEALGRYGADVESDRRRQIERARLAWRYDLQSRRAVEMWTDFGFGQRIKVVPEDDNLVPIWDEFWSARRNKPILADRKIANKVCIKTLIDGEMYFLFYWSPLDGKVTIRRILTDEISQIVKHPMDADVTLFYVRDMGQKQITLPNGDKVPGITKLYYPDWQADPDQLAAAEIPNGAARIDKLTDGETGTRFVMQQMALNEDDNGRGWPQFFQIVDWTKAYRELIQDWAAVAKGNAMFVRRLTTGSGSRAVDAIRGRFASTLSSDNAVETNPPTAAGGTFVHNRAMDMNDVPLNRGAGDARETSMLMIGQVSTGTGSIPVHYLGRPDMLQNRATARETVRPFDEAMERFQVFWGDGFSEWVEIVGRASEQAKKGQFQTLEAKVSLQSPTTYDPNELATTMNAITNALAAAGIDADVAQRAIEALVAISLTMYGLHDTDAVLHPEDEEERPEEESDIAGLGQWAHEVAEMVRQNQASGSVTPEQVAEFAVAQLIEIAGGGNGHK
jgi:hypothetical protein